MACKGVGWGVIKGARFVCVSIRVLQLRRWWKAGGARKKRVKASERKALLFFLPANYFSVYTLHNLGETIFYAIKSAMAFRKTTTKRTENFSAIVCAVCFE